MNDDLNIVNDPAVDSVAAGLDRLAVQDAERPGLDERVYATSVHSLRSPAVLRMDTATGSRASRWTRPVLRIAAVIALVAGAGLMWSLMNRAAAPAPTAVAGAAKPAVNPEATDEWAIMTAVLGESGSTDLEEALLAENTLKERMDTLGTSDALEEGAM